MGKKREFKKPVIVAGAFKYPNSSTKVMNRTIEGSGKDLEDCVAEALSGRKDHGFPWVITGVPLVVMSGNKWLFYKVDLKDGHYIIEQYTPRKGTQRQLLKLVA